MTSKSAKTEMTLKDPAKDVWSTQTRSLSSPVYFDLSVGDQTLVQPKSFAEVHIPMDQ